MRLAILFLRARLTCVALTWFAAAAALTWVWLTRFDALPVGLALVTLPLLPAVVVGAVARSPFGEAEETASRPMPVYCALHILGLTIAAAVLLVTVATAVDAADLRLALARTLVGFVGLALLGGRAIGSRVAWLTPLAYAALVLYLDPASRWAWPIQMPVEGWSVVCAMALMAAGLFAVTRPAARDRFDEQ
ncbi:MAG: hypothetical protein V9F06_14500 [Thermomicrobiales bacterium]